MGQSLSTSQKPLAGSSSGKKLGKESWRETWRGPATPAATNTGATIPEDNIFVPIAQDNILPQIPIGQHHPVPRLGIEDDDKHTFHTNKFYANSFLGDQTQPVWTQPYSIWWGRGNIKNEPGQWPTWGMNIAYIEADDVVISEGDPPKVNYDESYHSIKH